MANKETRNEVANITKQWVEDNCKNITDRDLSILNILYENKRRILRRDQIQTLLPEKYKFASINRLNKRLKMLYELHIIDKIYPKVPAGKGSSQQHICLDRAGIILLNAKGYSKPIRVDSFGNKSLPLGWKHKVTVNEHECICSTIFDKILLYENEEPIKYGNNTIIPDSICVGMRGGKGYSLIFEIDMGTEDIKVLKKKIDNYIELYMSHQWERIKWSKIFKNPVFPRVIISLTESTGKRFKEIAEYCKNKTVRFSVTTHSEISDLILNIVK